MAAVAAPVTEVPATTGGATGGAPQFSSLCVGDLKNEAAPDANPKLAGSACSTNGSRTASHTGSDAVSAEYAAATARAAPGLGGQPCAADEDEDKGAGERSFAFFAHHEKGQHGDTAWREAVSGGANARAPGDGHDARAHHHEHGVAPTMLYPDRYECVGLDPVICRSSSSSGTHNEAPQRATRGAPGAKEEDATPARIGGCHPRVCAPMLLHGPGLGVQGDGFAGTESDASKDGGDGQRCLTTLPGQYPQHITCNFHVSDIVGQGAFSVVKLLLTKREDPPRSFALKVLEKGPLQLRGMMNQVAREFALQKRVTENGKAHSRIMNLVDYVEDTTHCYCVLEYMPNGNLPLLCSKYPNFQLPERIAGFIFGQVLEGVRFLHSLRIVHRDLKPDNMMFDDHWMAKIGDFGWCAEFNTGSEERRTMCGTASYMSPEILQGKPQLEGAVDLWACGILLYQILVGDTPFAMPHNTDFDYMHAIMNLNYTFPQSMSYWPSEIITGFLQINPLVRHPSETVLRTAWIQATYSGPLARNRIPSMLPTEHEDPHHEGGGCHVAWPPSLLFANNGCMTVTHRMLPAGAPFKIPDMNVKASVLAKSLPQPELNTNGPAQSPTRQRQVFLSGAHAQNPRNICLSPPRNDRDLRRVPPRAGSNVRQDKAVGAVSGASGLEHATQGTPQAAPPVPPHQGGPHQRQAPDEQHVLLASPRIRLFTESSGSGAAGPAGFTSPAFAGFRSVNRPNLRDVTPFGLPFARQQIRRYTSPLPPKSPGR